ncbi:3-hydroxyacyl-CoA dehydrogenase NAD-binding domain-containing protein [Micromonospora sp. RTGN7]|uniref:3-hydroxyacyl-CoA dehydrogenase NAD-binding domain-containing protein n=1 Tax=Micromonospora sp. RTGN7 TaxID=3016526 RepID=UPI0029FF55A5|nr:3-hydroxyacyl-CoA dehydrogenase NAD-binding domain-containing protein [Micromonospora sp. RTGN7]
MADRIRAEIRGEVLVLWLDAADRTVNVVDEVLLAELDAQLRGLADRTELSAAVLASAKPGSFGTGADLDWLPQLARREDAIVVLEGIHSTMLRMTASPKPIVAAVEGRAYGGALELALGARVIVCSASATFGFPEVTLGLIPGGGGTQLLRRFVGTAKALDLLTTGRSLSASDAAAAGLARLVDGDPVTAAVTIAHELARQSPENTVAEEADLTVIRDRESREVAPTEAKRAIFAAVSAGVAGGIEAGLRVERERFVKLLRGPEFAAARHLKDIESRIRRATRASSLPPLSTLGVIGAGQMGSGIAAVASSRGIDVVIRDVDDERLAAARERRNEFVAQGSGHAGSWTATTGWDRLAGVDAVIEAVFEVPKLKHDVLTEVAAVVPSDAVIATNTSAISVGSLAPSVPNPSRFMGMHFFSPVERMRLIELVPHAGTTPATVEASARLGAAMGKVPIVVADSPGFYTSRVYARWLVEGVRLVIEGMAVEAVDHAARLAGFPAGPLQAIDQATLQLVLQASIGHVARRLFTDRLDIDAVEAVLTRLIEQGAGGRAASLGFYRYEAGRRAGANPELRAGRGPSESAARSRLLLSFVSEALLCWDEGIIEHPDDGDIAAVLGIGFPGPLGGPFYWVDQVGPAAARERAAGFGKAFPMGSALDRLVQDRGSFANESRRPTNSGSTMRASD